jgi:hypothetical protein
MNSQARFLGRKCSHRVPQKKNSQCTVRKMFHEEFPKLKEFAVNNKEMFHQSSQKMNPNSVHSNEKELVFLFFCFVLFFFFGFFPLNFVMWLHWGSSARGI